MRSQLIVVTSTQPGQDSLGQLRGSVARLTASTEVRLVVTGAQWLVDLGPRVTVLRVPEAEQRSVSDLADTLAVAARTADTSDRVKFFAEQFSVAAGGRVSGKFVVETNLRSSLLVLASTLAQEDIEVFQLTSPRGRVHSFPVLDKGAAYFRLSGPSEAGVWSYSAQLTPATLAPTVPVHVAAYAAVTEASLPAVELEAWTSIQDTKPNPEATVSPPPVTIYARVTEGGLAVVEAEVVATVVTPDGESVEVALRDSGLGYPDLAAADGVYSGYFTQFSQLAGLYSVAVTVTNHHGRAGVRTPGQEVVSPVCGLQYRRAATVPALHFTRSTRAPSFFLAEGVRFSIQGGVPARPDLYPPRRITDLRVRTVADSELVEVSWTAPGDDLDQGTAASYQLRWSEDRRQLSQQLFSAAQLWTEAAQLLPSPAGTLEQLNLTVPRVNSALYVAVVAVDAAANTGAVSNIVPVFVAREERAAADSAAAATASTAVSSLTLLGAEVPAQAWVYIVSVSLATVGLVVIMLAVILVRRRRMRKLQERCPIPYFIELGPPQHKHETAGAEHQLTKPNLGATPPVDHPNDTLSYPGTPAQHPVLELYEAHARQYALYQNLASERSSSSTSSGSEASSGAEQGRSPFKYPHHHHTRELEAVHNGLHQDHNGHNGLHPDSSEHSHASSLSSQRGHASRQSRRRRESFV